jgi:anhydro-N-acetylmuramic acid kinase
VAVGGQWPSPTIELLDWSTAVFPGELRAELMALYPPNRIRIEDLSRLNVTLGDFYADAILELLNKTGFTAAEVTAIGCRGLTVGHFPSADRSRRGHRIEISEPAVIAERTGITVLSDYGARDQAAGGHGVLGSTATVDYLLFHGSERSIAIQNIGGIGNVCYVKANGTLDDLMAFDTGPGNVFIDLAAMRATDGAQTYDRDGELASQGSVCQELVTELVDSAFFRRPPPKSTGREEFGLELWSHIQGRAVELRLSDPDLVATMTAYTARAIRTSYQNFLFPLGRVDQVVLTGGGAYNRVLVDLLSRELSPIPLSLHDEFGIPAAIREAVTWAVIAAASYRGEPTGRPQVSGASRSVVYGRFTPGGSHWGAAPFVPTGR